MPKQNHKIGDKVGPNILLDYIIKNKRGYFLCQCECGKERLVRADQLQSYCRSCAAKKRPPHIIDDLTGKTFGNWIVLSKANKVNYWHCQDKTTGTERDVFRGNLTQGLSKGDGSVSSWGEQQICYLLKQKNIPYKKEYTFTDLKTEKGGTPRFDFAIFKNDNLFCLIEYDGRQHYHFDENWKMNENDYQILQNNDKLKTEYCKNNHIALLRWNEDTDLEKEIAKLK